MNNKQKLIEELNRQIDALDMTKPCSCIVSEALTGIMAYVHTMPPAGLPWIPVNSGILPETGQQIFATCEQEGESDVMEIYYNSELLVPPWRMTAWMPAEPYKG